MLDNSLKTIPYSVAIVLTMSVMQIENTKQNMRLNNSIESYHQSYKQCSSVTTVDYIKSMPNYKISSDILPEPTVIAPKKTYKLNVKVIYTAKPEPIVL